jgi:predicted PurR-regulated permease PerM
VVPIAVITFFAAFIPFAGAVLSGTVAVLVTLVTGGIGGALVVLAVAVLIQQLDNDFLAPLIYGRGLELHPLVVLFALAGGSALMGPVGALFAVPLSAVVVNVIADARAARREENERLAAGPDGSDGTDPVDPDSSDGPGAAGAAGAADGPAAAPAV